MHTGCNINFIGGPKVRIFQIVSTPGGNRCWAARRGDPECLVDSIWSPFCRPHLHSLLGAMLNHGKGIWFDMLALDVRVSPVSLIYNQHGAPNAGLFVTRTEHTPFFARQAPSQRLPQPA